MGNTVRMRGRMNEAEGEEHSRCIEQAVRSTHPLLRRIRETAEAAAAGRLQLRSRDADAGERRNEGTAAHTLHGLFVHRLFVLSLWLDQL